MVAESDSGVQWFEERTGADAVLMQYLWGLYVDEITHCVEFEMGMPMTYYMMCSDLLYRSTALLNASANIAEAYDTDAYGNTIMFDAAGSGSNWWADDAATTADPKCQFIFTGRRLDPELSDSDSQMYYYRARPYEPGFGRFVSRAPIAYAAGSMGLYEYVGGMATIFIDPMGLLELPDRVKGAVSAVARAGGFGVVGAVAEAGSPGIAGEVAGASTEAAGNFVSDAVEEIKKAVNETLAEVAQASAGEAALLSYIKSVDPLGWGKDFLCNCNAKEGEFRAMMRDGFSLAALVPFLGVGVEGGIEVVWIFATCEACVFAFWAGGYRGTVVGAGASATKKIAYTRGTGIWEARDYLKATEQLGIGGSGSVGPVTAGGGYERTTTESGQPAGSRSKIKGNTYYVEAGVGAGSVPVSVSAAGPRYTLLGCIKGV
jgi:RHS repeat-associated protein